MGLHDSDSEVFVLKKVSDENRKCCLDILEYLIETKVINQYETATEVPSFLRQEVCAQLTKRDKFLPIKLSKRVIRYLISVNIIPDIPFRDVPNSVIEGVGKIIENGTT
jgi:hypothetical protein